MRVSEIRVKQIRVNQGLGVHSKRQKFTVVMKSFERNTNCKNLFIIEMKWKVFSKKFSQIGVFPLSLFIFTDSLS